MRVRVRVRLRVRVWVWVWVWVNPTPIPNSYLGLRSARLVRITVRVSLTYPYAYTDPKP